MTFGRRLRLSTVFASVACALYGLSFFLPVYQGAGDAGSAPGWLAFVVALLGMKFEGQGTGFHPGWLANPAFWTGLVLLLRGWPRCAFGFGAAATLLSASFLTMLRNPGDRQLVGYYAWLASMVLLVAAGCAEFRQVRGSNTPV